MAAVECTKLSNLRLAATIGLEIYDQLKTNSDNPPSSLSQQRKKD